jgi:integrase
MGSKPKQFEGRLYLGRDESGREQYEWLGRFADKKERDQAVMRRRIERESEAAQAERPAGERITCAGFVDQYLARYERERKDSSYDTARSSLARFKADFGSRMLASVARHEAIEWAESVPPSRVPIVVTLFNVAVDQELVNRNPFRGLGHRTRGRRDEHPPTADEFDRLLAGCAALGDYAPQMQALLIFGAYTGMRPGELFALDWGDIDFKANRVHVQRRLYRGSIDVPKSNKPRTIALPPPARDVLLRQPTRSGELVFLSKRGERLSQPTMSGYWAQVKAKAGLDFDFYLASKHYGVHLLYKLGLSSRAIGAQMGWSEKAVESLLQVYGHKDLVALSEVDALYASNVVALRSAAETDANPTQEVG